MRFCANCGGRLAPEARFCPSCGTAVAASNVSAAAATPPRSTPATPVAKTTGITPKVSAAGPASTAPPQHPNNWWIVPAVIVGLFVIAWLVLAGLPFGNDERRIAVRPTDTVGEAPAP